MRTFNDVRFLDPRANMSRYARPRFRSTRRVIGDDLHLYMVRRGVCRNCATISSIDEAYSRWYPLISRERGHWWPL